MHTLLLCAIVGTTTPVIVNSHIYAVDIEQREYSTRMFKEPIIDSCIDDWLYVLTAHYLFKIHLQDLSIKDRIPLPQRYNSVIAGLHDIYLVTTNEIIVIDKDNLAFKSGIGIEHGDYTPVMMTRSSSMSPSKSALMLLSSSGDQSALKIFDVFDGRLVKKVTVDKIESFTVSELDGSLIAIDIKNNITTYHEQLRRKHTIKLDLEGIGIHPSGDDFLIYTKQALFRVNHQGQVIDFQPIGATYKPLSGELVCAGQSGVICIDSLTLRIRGCSRNFLHSRTVVPFSSHDGQHVLALDESMHNLSVLNCSNLTTYALNEKPPRIGESVHLPQSMKGDSLWYFQLGAFSYHEYAQDMYNSFRLQSLPVFVDSTELFRVKLGGFKNKEDAQELIEHAGLNGWFMLDRKRQCTETVEFEIGPSRYLYNNGIITRSE